MDSRITPEMAREELARRQEARAELQRRSLDDTFKSQVKKIPGYALGAAVSFPGKVLDFASQIPGAIEKFDQDPRGAIRDLAGGALYGAQNIGAALGQLVEYPAHAAYEKISGNKVPHYNVREMFGLEGENPVDLRNYISSKNPNALLSGIGQYGLGASMGGAKLLPMMAANAINSAVQAPPGHRLQQGVEGAVIPGIGVGIGKGINYSKPSNIIARNTTLSPEELKANLEAAEGTTTSLGNIIGSPFLKKAYENVLTKVPFSGANTALQNTGKQLIEKGEEHLENLGKGLPEENHATYLQEALKKASKESNKQKNANFNKVNLIADKERIVVPRTNFQNKAKEILDEINESPELKREFDPKLLSDIQSYANNSEGNSLKLSNIFKGKLNDRATEFYLNGKKYEYGLLRDLKEAMGSDIDETINSTKNPKLKNAYDQAMEEYITKYRPFEDPDITKFTREGGDPDILLSHFLRTGANDRSLLLSKLLDKVPKSLQHLPAFMYLSKALEDGKFNPLKFRTLYNKLGENQLKTLIPSEEIRNSLKKYTKSVGMNTESLETMLNPKTGQRVSDFIPYLGAAGGYKALAGLGGPILGGAIGLPLGAIAPGIVAKGAVKYLTSPKIRENLVNAIIEKKLKQKP